MANERNNNYLNDTNKETNPFSLPKNYFNEFANKLQLKIELEEELKEFKLLSTLEKSSPNFSVPENYFEVLPNDIKTVIHTLPSKKTSFITWVYETVFSSKTAYTIGVLGLVLIVFFELNINKPSLINTDCKTLACLNKTELLNDHIINDLDDEHLLDLVNEDAIYNTINNNISINDKQQQGEYLIDNMDATALLEEL